MAAPFVTGAIGLLASKNPESKSTDLIQALYLGADQSSDLVNTSVDGRLLNIPGSLAILESINNPPPELAIAADLNSINEGNQGPTLFTFTVTRTGQDLSQNSSVQWAVVHDETNINDFVTTSGTVLFTDNSESQVISVEVAGDTEFENNERFSIVLSSPTNATISDDSASAVIINDDSQPAPPTETVLFTENFESGDTWNHWEQDSQNDWKRRENRRAINNFSAEVDGRSNNAWIGLRDSLDISSFEDVQVNVKWLIETSFDNGEFLAIDVSIDNQAWQEVDRLSGSSGGVGGDERSGNPFQDGNFRLSESITNFADASTLNLRFRSTSSNGAEDAYIDNIEIIGIDTNANYDASSSDAKDFSYSPATFGLLPDPLA